MVREDNGSGRHAVRLPAALIAFAAAALAALFTPRAASAAPAAIPDQVNFNRDIRPILAENCYACHGFDKNKRKADLRLDTEEGAYAALEDGGHPVVPGDPDKSSVYLRITTADEDEVMPPPKTGKKLTERQVELIRKWIEQGAKYQPHWSYIRPERTDLPKVDGPEGFPVRNAVDTLILAKLHEADLAPSAEADRATLIRRLSFDLTGLPPKAEEVDAFVNDQSPEAYENLVDRLLASPAYGERMAMYWLDLVRYADSIGYHSDNPMPVSPYRDYVIRAFNKNMPYDQFTVEQLAGDLIENGTTSQKVASAYNRLLQTTEEGGAQAKEYEAKYSADRVRNVSTVWIGQTMGCAECHDHKFDPISTKDFYQFAAFFADIQEPAVGGRGPGTPVPDEQSAQEVEQLDQQIAALRQTLDQSTPELEAAQAEWEKQLGSGDTQWVVLDPETVAAAAGTTLTEQAEGVVIAGGAIPATETYTVTAKTDLKGITAFRLEALSDPSFANNGPGASNNGNFVLTEFKVSAAVGDGAAQEVALRGATAAHSQDGWPVAGTIDGNNQTGWAILQATGQNHTAIFEVAAPVAKDAAGPVTLTFTLDHQQIYAQHNIGKFRLAATTNPNPAGHQVIPPNVQTALAVAPEQRNDQQKAEVAAYYRTVAPLLQPVREQIAQNEARKTELLASTASVLLTMSGQPRTIRVLPRGNWLDETGEIVQPEVPAYFGSLGIKDRRPTRMDLAKWVVSRDNPLTARVMVNRLWKLYFGQGLSKTLDDLGAQGEWPTHPELLDWLAVEFMESGWDVKHVVKLLVMSSTYRQTSYATKELKERDPYNRLYGRQSRFRLDAEMVRDNALAVSGMLVNKVGGKSVFPYQPAGYWYALNFPPREWQNDKGEGLYRRGLYTHWQRSFLHPSLLAFDAPSREECTVERARSNIPQQALVLLNDPTYVEAARIFAERIVREGGAEAEGRVRWAFKTALSREASGEEVRVLLALVEKHAAEYAADVESAKKLLSVGDRPASADLDPAGLAAWTSVARTILNLHETITRS